MGGGGGFAGGAGSGCLGSRRRGHVDGAGFGGDQKGDRVCADSSRLLLRTHPTLIFHHPSSLVDLGISQRHRYHNPHDQPKILCCFCVLLAIQNTKLLIA
ncbi:hypothetical protein FIBSPDRAFT_432902 [Athelia psychrophila]|uniref:Uncharacterized protein n=1 Tax=Athelia psychrophila TaxID=1759441 RepID=A0A167UII8_9AGAM|nr:hypothetical protein FIBSPDRAFT_432902 [Fibularhizoctonia sp. CBS 109695]